jgi:tetratricopeptide (TPR) repeat protein
MLHLQLALSLLQQHPESPANDCDLDEAAASLRRALEIYKRESNVDLWGRALALLGRIEFARAERHGQSDIPTKKELVRRSLSRAIAAFEKARIAFKPGTFDWLRIMVDLGDVRLSVDLEAAAATYTEMLSLMENTPRLTKEEQASDLGMALADLSIRAIAGLQSIDRLKDGQPVVPRDLLEIKQRGQLLYLRPWLSAGHLLLPNQCVPGAFKVGYRTEPRNISLEALLYRALALDLNFISLGGRADGYGATRMIMAAGGTEWQSSLKLLEVSADLILMAPHLSEGVRWEIKLLSERRSLGKTLFIMPPLATDIDVPRLWAEATPMMAEYGLEVPPYQPDGSIFSFGPDGKVAERWEFGLLWENKLLSAIGHLLPKAGVNSNSSRVARIERLSSRARMPNKPAQPTPKDGAADR